MKVNSTLYKGIEYVQVGSLPSDQRELLLQTINRDLLIKILVEGKLIGNCLQFKDYEVWFDNIFNAKKSAPQDHKEQKDQSQPAVIPAEMLKKA